MKKIFLITLVFVFINTLLFAQKKDIQKIELANDRASIELPTSFNLPIEIPVILNDSLPTSKHYIFINKKNQLITLRYQYPEMSGYAKITDNEIPEWADKQLELIKKNTRTTYVNDGIYLQNWKNISYIKFITKQDNGNDTFDMLFFTNFDDRVIQFHFSCPVKLRKKWEPIADNIANSLRIKE